MDELISKEMADRLRNTLHLARITFLQLRELKQHR
jgi:hypothetical protein